jgi:hypothetical protein
MTRHAARHMWRLSEAGEDNLGLACSDDGLFIGRTPLIEKRDGQFFVRQRHDIERLLSRAYRTEIRADRLMSGLTSVARALNADDQCLARIAAVHLRVPDIPDRAARDAMEAMDAFIKYARGEVDGDTNWNPALHPRTGTPPNPGWFAPTEGAADEPLSERTAQNDDPTRRLDVSSPTNEDWIRLPPGPKRIDELSDLIEWILNAKAEDAAAIRAEIDRYFTNVGWESAAHDLKNMSAVLIRPGITNEDRRKYLNRLDLYTRVDPAEYLRVFGIVAGIAMRIGRAPPAAGEHRATGEGTGQAEAVELPDGSLTPGPTRGGRLGSPATRAQNAEIAAALQKQGFIITGGGGEAAEEYIRGAGPGTRGGTFVDITAINKETGAVTRVQTIDTLADGNPTPREAAAAAKIRASYPNDILILIPKRSAR